ncbi:hypothetical protein FGM00_03710 [Aggregatimonas sangjinii]|uniref:T9SS C-terminal target domain-containing protein n=1 Tax=Aggregatimonas sangjinii TaxID=2583587 RepID=A0A5B7SPD8_9FLAO|nr:hypothetical protein [Aggregatimonas sangjinii]QCW99258.1 hypothetical protein FGM00_03710 [Aggregatimonas sangjinii]
MKKVIRTIAAAALLFATTTVMAKEPTLETVGNSKSIILEWNAHLSDASLKIYDANGIIIHSDNLKNADEYAKRFDLTPLVEGAYFLKIENRAKELVYSLSVNKNNITILGMAENFKPGYREKEGRVYLNFLNRDLKKVEVSVTDSLGNVLFKEVFNDKLVVEKAFNFKGAYEGDYTIAVNDGTKTFYETVSIK